MKLWLPRAIAACLLGLSNLANADVIILRNGDVLRGKVEGEKEGFLLVRPDTLPDVARIPVREIRAVRRGAVAPAETRPATPPPAANPAPPTLSATPPAPPPAPEAKPKASGWKLPKGWKGSFGLGYTDREGAHDNQETGTDAKLQWKGKKNEAEWTGQYKYFEQDGKKSADRYAGTQKLRHEGANGFHAQGQTKAEVDNINKDRTEVSQTAGLGYAPVKSDKLTVRVTPGVEVEKITDSPDKEANRVRYKANVQQEATWKLNDKVSVGQTATYAVDPKHDENWDVDFQAYLQSKLGENTNLRLNYKRDLLNGSKGKEDKKSGEVGAAVVWDF